MGGNMLGTCWPSEVCRIKYNKKYGEIKKWKKERMCVIVSSPPHCRESKKEKQKKKVSIFLHFPLAECSKEERKTSCVPWFFLAELKGRRRE